MIDGKLLTNGADLGAGQRSHGPTVRWVTDKTRCAIDRTARPALVIPSHDFIHSQHHSVIRTVVDLFAEDVAVTRVQKVCTGRAE